MKYYKNTMALMLTLILASVLTACGAKKTTETQSEVEQNTGTVTEVNEETNTTTQTVEENTTNPVETNSTNHESNTSTETNTTTEQNTTTTPAVTLKSLTLTVDKSMLNKEENTTVKVEATYSDNTSKELTDNVEWIVTPSDAIQVSNATLTALKDKATSIQAKVGTTLSNILNLNITWTVNGHTLPPEPDLVENDATLLGVDSNNDGVRDDIERKVYATYPKAIQRAVMMQAFRVEQKMLADPDMVDNARIWEKKISKPLNCRRYLYLYKGQPRIKKMASITDDWQYNNKERVKLYIEYNKALSGGVYSLGKPKLDDCEFNIDEVLELDK